MTCPNSVPMEKEQFKDSLVRCKMTGYACGIGYLRDTPCDNPLVTMRCLR